MLTTNEKLISALERLPVVQAAQKQVYADRCQHRGRLIQEIVDATKAFQKAETAIVARAAPIEKKLTATRAEVTKLEGELQAVASERVSLASNLDAHAARIREQLREDAADACEKFQRTIDITHSEVAGNAGGRRSAILSTMLASPSRIASALAVLLEAHREAGRIAFTEADVVDAMERIRFRLTAANISLVSDY